MEHILDSDGTGLLSRQFLSYSTFEDALNQLGLYSNGPIFLASSFQKVDNTFDTRG